MQHRPYNSELQNKSKKPSAFGDSDDRLRIASTETRPFQFPYPYLSFNPIEKEKSMPHLIALGRKYIEAIWPPKEAKSTRSTIELDRSQLRDRILRRNDEEASQIKEKVEQNSRNGKELRRRIRFDKKHKYSRYKVNRVAQDIICIIEEISWGDGEEDDSGISLN